MNLWTLIINAEVWQEERVPHCFCCFSQAAADYVKAHLPETLKQQLQAYEREKKDSHLSYPAILEQRILAVDRDMVDKFSSSHDEAGEQGRECFSLLLSMRFSWLETVNNAESFFGLQAQHVC